MSGPELLTVEQAAASLRHGAIIAYPTEAVYGLGCDPMNEAAVRRVLKLKKRPARLGLILIADEFMRFSRFVRPVGPEAMERAMSAWPGPVTWLFPRAEGVPDWLAGSHPTVAVRITAHPVCRALCAAFGGAIVSTSANSSREAPARTAAEVEAYFGPALDGIVEGELGKGSRPSEIRDLESGRILRQG